MAWVPGTGTLADARSLKPPFAEQAVAHATRNDSGAWSDRGPATVGRPFAAPASRGGVVAAQW
jgi:hypothetical protein